MLDFELIWKKLHNRISKEEEQKLISWLNEDSNHSEYYKRITGFYLNTGSFDLTAQDLNKAYNKLHNSTSRKVKIWKLVIYGFSVAAAITVFFIFFLNVNKQADNISIPEVSLSKNLIKPGETKALLILEDGTSYNLSDGNGLNKETEEVIIFSSGRSISYYGKPSPFEKKELRYNTLKIPRGGEFFITLSDSTKVWINSESELKYPVLFGKKNREIELTGEAYFEVSKDPTRPFRVYSYGQVTEVLGTKFNISSYQDDQVIYTTLLEGKVKVFSADNPSADQILQPSYQSSFSKINHNFHINKVDTEQYIAWKNGRFSFVNQRLDSIMFTMQRWYDVEINFRNNTVKEFRFTGNMKRYDDIEKILQLIGKTDEIEFKIKDRLIEIDDK